MKNTKSRHFFTFAVFFILLWIVLPVYADYKESLQACTQLWKLENIEEINYFSVLNNFVAKAYSAKYNSLVVIKIGDVASESEILQMFDEQGLVKLLDYNEIDQAMLLEYIPEKIKLFDVLRSDHNDDYLIDVFITSFKKIHKNQLPYNFKTTKLQSIFDLIQKFKTYNSILIPQQLLDKAIYISDQLTASAKDVYLLHGDLHCDNIIVTEHDCIAIDPRGIIGELECEATSFLISPIYCLVEIVDLRKLILHRIDRLSFELNFDRQRLQDWLFIKVIEAACFFEKENSRHDLVNTWIEFAHMLETIK